MGTCNSSSKGGGGGSGSLKDWLDQTSNQILSERKAKQQKIIDEAINSLDYKKQGERFNSLTEYSKSRISQLLKMDKFLQEAAHDYIEKGKKSHVRTTDTEELGGRKIKIITDYNDGKLSYTLKERNKILNKNMTKTQCANQLAAHFKREEKSDKEWYGRYGHIKLKDS